MEIKPSWLMEGKSSYFRRASGLSANSAWFIFSRAALLQSCGSGAADDRGEKDAKDVRLFWRRSKLHLIVLGCDRYCRLPCSRRIAFMLILGSCSAVMAVIVRRPVDNVAIPCFAWSAGDSKPDAFLVKTFWSR